MQPSRMSIALDFGGYYSDPNINCLPASHRAFFATIFFAAFTCSTTSSPRSRILLYLTVDLWNQQIILHSLQTFRLLLEHPTGHGILGYCYLRRPFRVYCPTVATPLWHFRDVGVYATQKHVSGRGVAVKNKRILSGDASVILMKKKQQGGCSRIQRTVPTSVEELHHYKSQGSNVL